MASIDQTDRQILRHLQSDATSSLEELAGRLSISTNTCWRRIKRLEEAGVIVGRIARIDPEKLGLHLTVFVAIKAQDHSAVWRETFADAVKSIPEIVEFYRMAGEVDYMLKLFVQNVADYDRVYKQLTDKVHISDVSASFAMECLRNTNALPI